MNTTKDKIKEILDESEKFAEANEGLLNAKIEVTMKSLGILLTDLNTGLDKLFEGIAETIDPKQGENLRETIKEAITGAIDAFTKVNHEINFAPSINIDIKPLQKEVSEAMGENKRIYSLIQKLSTDNGSRNEELYKLTLMMIEKHNERLGKLKDIDLSPQLTAINETLGKRATEWDIKVTKRDEVRGYLEEAKIKTVNNGR